MKVRKMPLRYGDGLEGQACGVVDLAPQAQAVAGKSVPHKPG
jgi:hypothetical protein